MVGVARTASEQVAGILKQIQEKVVQADGADTASLTKLQADVLRADQHDRLDRPVGAVQRHQPRRAPPRLPRTSWSSVIRDSAGALTTDQLVDAAPDLETLGATLTLTDDATANLDAVDTLLDSANTAAAAFGAAQARIEAQNAFLAKQADALKNGVGALVDADMEEASARLAALQTQQQLGIQALSIANQAPQNVLALFR